MIESILIFIVSSYEFAIDLKYTPLVVKAIRVLKKTEDAFSIIKSKINIKKDFHLVDLKKFLGFGETKITDRSRILVFESQNSSIGLLVDEVKYVISLDESSDKYLSDEESEEEKIYKTYFMGDKNIHIMNIDSVPEIQEKLKEINLLPEASILIGTLEKRKSNKKSDDMVAMSLSVEAGKDPALVTVLRDGKLTLA